MKKLVTIIFFILCSLEITAQMTVGPRLGINFSKHNSGSLYEIWKTGTMIGGVLNIPIKNDLALQAELLLTQKGYLEQYNGNEAFDELISTYLEIPVYASYTRDFGRFKPFVNAGPYFAWWKSGKYQSKLEGQQLIVEEYEFTENYDQDGYKDNRFDYGVSVGLGILYDRIGAAGNIVLDLRYNKGLMPVSSLLNESADYTPRYNSTFTLSLAYMFYL
ncbi:MAG: PorT family protein [Bacteroidetes bacterium]|nr:PorT family protein [Bacteroidota bacterium]MCH8232644.1 PorT family protein [Bacteroidota bacterium]